MTTICCPRCKSSKIITLDHGRKIGGMVGAVAGAARGTSATLGGAKTGDALSTVAGPSGVILGSLAGIVMDALICGAAGCTTGAIAGEAIDENLLNNYQCQACGFTFGKQSLSEN
jgi:hypothetical protein